ncbi:MAG TPA: hypothetical protein VGG41_06235 [Solirubrobacteraceae bacterium]
MSVRWEYLTVAWTLTATPPSATSEAWGLVGSIQISRPGEDGSDTRTYDASVVSTIAFDLLNELGADGWELVSHVVERSTVTQAQGYQTVGVPISSTQIFKRPVA